MTSFYTSNGLQAYMQLAAIKSCYPGNTKTLLFLLSQASDSDTFNIKKLYSTPTYKIYMTQEST